MSKEDLKARLKQLKAEKDELLIEREIKMMEKEVEFMRNPRKRQMSKIQGFMRGKGKCPMVH